MQNIHDETVYKESLFHLGLGLSWVVAAKSSLELIEYNRKTETIQCDYFWKKHSPQEEHIPKLEKGGIPKRVQNRVNAKKGVRTKRSRIDLFLSKTL